MQQSPKQAPDLETDYDIQVHSSTSSIDGASWNALLSLQPTATPFMKYEYLSAMQLSLSAFEKTGWVPRFVTIHTKSSTTSGPTLIAACPLYLKTHSYGEFVFDWAWASAFEQHGLPYYPKALVAVPFTPVPGTRLMALDKPSRTLLAHVLKGFTEQKELSSLHLLFGDEQDLHCCEQAGFTLRHTVQFHWQNAGYHDFNEFLRSLNQEKRKKIKQERARVEKAGVTFISKHADQISTTDWDFFYQCYSRTYYEHGNAPYLTPEFFKRMQETMAKNWVLFIAKRADGTRIASSLVSLSDELQTAGSGQERVAYGRYWGALERVDCLHFEACYYQPIEWCIQNGIKRFEGGAQGEHKMARALLPVKTSSAHYVVNPAFAKAVNHFLAREEQGVESYMQELERRTPLKTQTLVRDKSTKE